MACRCLSTTQYNNIVGFAQELRGLGCKGIPLNYDLIKLLPIKFRIFSVNLRNFFLRNFGL